MKVSFISDLHLDFHVRFTPNQDKWEKRTRDFIQKLIATDTGEKDILCLGGDYSHYNQQTKWLIDEFSKVYNEILIIFGNHDYYLISKTQANKYNHQSINRILEIENFTMNYSNVTVLFKGRVFHYKGKKFSGDCMWYPIETIEQKVFFHEVSNDSKYIMNFDINFSNFISKEDYFNAVEESKVDVFITHVPIIHIKSHSLYNSTSCYYTPVDVLPPYVIMGHSHEQEIYEKAGSRLYMNCLGYPEQKMEISIKSFTA